MAPCYKNEPTKEVFSEGMCSAVLKVRPTPVRMCSACFTHCVLELFIIFTVISFHNPFQF